MDRSEIYKTIRQIVESNLPGSRVLLFGSHARGDYDRFSDYDLLIITPLTFTSKEKVYWSTLLDRAIVTAINAPIDLLLNSEEEVVEKQQLPGHIIRSAIREGIAL
ncbi:nucleotidyltransferase domain-containing protein [Mucilaginibacter sp. UR6-11]|uniref:nucleotidyltransferase domain-containing protein n=1 Tax=Mucilaginibacter sp. UR6-11 TaxID=1435644 RepID=UPI00351D2564|nr:nucleotidyltransferase domain-containing protein [Mucilaginibacter sp. UR6-11]